MIAQAERDRSKEAIYSNDNDIDVLYLFACQAEWRASCNEEAFWELLSSRHQARCGRLPEGLLATPLARIDWSKAQNQLQEIARASGGRAYENMIDLSATYDDRMENLKVRYVITDRSSSDGDLSIPRTVLVELVNPSNGEPLEIGDSNAKTIRAKVVVQESYIPKTASGG